MSKSELIGHLLTKMVHHERLPVFQKEPNADRIIKMEVHDKNRDLSRRLRPMTPELTRKGSNTGTNNYLGYRY